MTASEFREWRLAMGWTQQLAADWLGVNVRTIKYYEQGISSSGAPQEHVPKSIAIAALGIRFARDVAELDGEEQHDDDENTAAGS
jgi:transcriptional regulator with XRE-family HTH domain